VNRSIVRAPYLMKVLRVSRIAGAWVQAVKKAMNQAKAATA
jgi:hypothetical protein